MLKSCKRCKNLKYDVQSEKVFRCKRMNKPLNYPRLHGYLCKHRIDEVIRVKGADTNDGNGM